MNKIRKIRLVALGDAKRLTKGGIVTSAELDGRPQKTNG